MSSKVVSLADTTVTKQYTLSPSNIFRTPVGNIFGAL